MDIDYISELPADLKDEILVQLPIKEAVKTSILSSKWKDAWTSIPDLVFERNSLEFMTIRLVDNVLIFHHGPILKFKLGSVHACNEAISRWMIILSRNRIKDLELSFGSREACKIPSRLFSCLALERLILSECIINVPQNFQGFKLLHTLYLFSFKLSGITTIENLVSGCPLLERLTLFEFVQQGCLHIIAPNLRELDILGEYQDLCLETPKLVSGWIYLNGDHEEFLIAKAGKESNIKKSSWLSS
ncbi:F-box/RNI/FBD-like domain protein [Rhynchospora pubera]|uniref:F-box/RNI/FBD-like domain protein n=1 Tax=Rhynchospora pubera TaxID=906938 RepID=A0AAV8H676_9POAL|nr:F-box/RNI/FBD-like domain protein [Rhynchospora pubera]